MAGRQPMDTRARDLRALHQAARIAHGWDPADPPPARFTPRDALTFLLGFALVVTLVVLWLATGQPPAVHA